MIATGSTWAAHAQQLGAIIVVLVLIVAALAVAVVMLAREVRRAAAPASIAPPPPVARGDALIAQARDDIVRRLMLRAGLAAAGAVLALLLWGWASLATADDRWPAGRGPEAVETSAARGRADVAPAGLRALVSAAAAAEGVPAAIAHAVIVTESGYRPGLRGAAGEWGLGQIKCATARGLGFAGSCSALAVPTTNLRWAMRYLRLALDRGGPGCAGVTLYNTGLGRRPHCSGYGRRVMARARGA